MITGEELLHMESQIRTLRHDLLNLYRKLEYGSPDPEECGRIQTEIENTRNEKLSLEQEYGRKYQEFMEYKKKAPMMNESAVRKIIRNSIRKVLKEETDY